MMDPVVIIGCGKAKRALASGAVVPIRDLYAGSLYRARLAYAEALGGPHYVLSAVYRLAAVDTEVGTYEADLRKRSKAERVAWTEAVLAQVQRAIPVGRPIVALVAGPYADWIPHARARGYTVDVPAEGLPVGMAIRWLRNATDVLRDHVTEDEAPPSFDHEREASEVLDELEHDPGDPLGEWTLSEGTLRALLAMVEQRAQRKERAA